MRAVRRGLLFAGALIVVFMLGPRIQVDDQLAPVVVSGPVVDYLERSEARFDNILPGTEKRVVWRDDDAREKTDVAIVFIHGFSATRAELAPLCDVLADLLRANVFYTRLAGHGRGGDALADATVNDWLHDVVEAVEIGLLLGDSVVMIGNSTGATLASWFLSTQDTDRILAAVLLAPNFQPYDSRSSRLLWPWGQQLTTLFIGETRSWVPHNERQAYYWTTAYPSSALLQMMGLVDLVAETDFSGVSTPVLTLYSLDDRVIDPRAVERRFEDFGTSDKRLVAIGPDGPASHALAGDIMSPRTTQVAVGVIHDFLAHTLEDPSWLLARAEPSGSIAVYN